MVEAATMYGGHRFSARAHPEGASIFSYAYKENILPARLPSRHQALALLERAITHEVCALRQNPIFSESISRVVGDFHEGPESDHRESEIANLFRRYTSHGDVVGLIVGTALARERGIMSSVEQATHIRDAYDEYATRLQANIHSGDASREAHTMLLEVYHRARLMDQVILALSPRKRQKRHT